MEKIIKKDGYVYLVKDWDKPGFETFSNLGKDPDSPIWKPKKEKKNIETKKENDD